MGAFTQESVTGQCTPSVTVCTHVPWWTSRQRPVNGSPKALIQSRSTDQHLQEQFAAAEWSGELKTEEEHLYAQMSDH